MNYKTRSNYASGSKVCADKCQCLICKRERKEKLDKELSEWQQEILTLAKQKKMKKCPQDKANPNQKR